MAFSSGLSLCFRLSMVGKASNSTPFTSTDPLPAISRAFRIFGSPGTMAAFEWNLSVAELIITTLAGSSTGSRPATSGVYGSVTMETPPPSILKQACPYHLIFMPHPLPAPANPYPGYNVRRAASGELQLLPLHGAADRSGLCGRGFFSGKHRLEGVTEVVAPHGCRIVVIVVHRAVVAQSAALVEEEDLGGTLGPVGAGDLLRLIVEVGEVEPLLLRALLHPGEAIVGVLLCVVGADGDELHAAGGIVGLYLDQAVLPGSGVGAMVAGEDHRHGFFVRVVFEGVAHIVHAGQLEGYCLIAWLQVGHVSSLLFRNDFTER